MSQLLLHVSKYLRFTCGKQILISQPNLFPLNLLPIPLMGTAYFFKLKDVKKDESVSLRVSPVGSCESTCLISTVTTLGQAIPMWTVLVPDCSPFIPTPSPCPHPTLPLHRKANYLRI